MSIFKSIRSQLLFTSLLPAITVAIGMTVYFHQILISSVERSLVQHGEIIARQLALTSAQYLFNHQHQRLAQLLNVTLQNRYVREITIVDGQGKQLIRATDPSSVENGNDEVIIITAPIPLALDDPDKENVDLVADDTYGMVRVVLSASQQIAQQQQLVLRSLGILLAGVLLALGLAKLLTQRLFQPIRALQRAVTDITKGKLETRADFIATGELKTLRDGFNVMAEKLEQSQTQLENKVYQATVRLQHALQDLETRNRELEQARAKAVEQNRQKSQFLAQVSHEIRTPMNGIIGLSEDLLKTPLSDRQYEHLQLIYRSATDLLNIINEILDSTQIESGHIKVRPVAMSLRPCLEECVALLASKTQQVRLILWIDSNLPDEIVSDPLRIRQIITNLVGNAIKFTKSGWIVIRVRWSQSHRLLFFSISDTGCGIALGQCQRIFQPFVSLTKDEQEGTGLGLNITRKLVEKMGGTIECTSISGKGSTFWFTLPVSRWQKNPKPTFCRVALIDILPLSQHALKAQLENLGAEVDILTLDKIENPEHQPWHALIFVIPEQNPSFESIKRHSTKLRGQFQIPIILAGPYHCAQYESHYRTLGAIAFVSIPSRSEFWRQQLQTIVNAEQMAKQRRPIEKTSKFIEKQNRILVVDDNDINRMVVKAQLADKGIEIIEAANGSQAMELADSLPFDLILMDLQMPDYSGVEVLKHIKSNAQGVNFATPVVAVTAHASPDQLESLKKIQFSDLLIKPIFEDKLNQILKTWLKKESVELEKTNRTIKQIAEGISQRLQGNHQLGAKIIEKLLDELPGQIKDIAHALDEKDYSNAQSIVHKVHGSAAFCGIPKLKDLAEDLEIVLENEDEAGIPMAWQAFHQEAKHLLQLGSSLFEILSKQ
ncbi:MAG: hypothetical protein AXA67_01940 [Methylothermaceae bacteria B42]|nr:MAG: hypothetical protein AXA67_01940 [Methylothermaceae bacteria B42]HHJ37871.1 response regulator [Methylothermaceae bacterium]